MEHDMQPANRSRVTWIVEGGATRGAALTVRATQRSRRSLAALPAALASVALAAALAFGAPVALAAGDAPPSAAPAVEAPRPQQDQGQQTGNFLKNMMKTGPKAPDAWCQRDATQRVLTQAKAVPQSPTAGAGAGAELMAATPDDCNPEFAGLLGACVNDPGHAAPPPRDASLSDRTRLCLAHLAEAGVKASR